MHTKNYTVIEFFRILEASGPRVVWSVDIINSFFFSMKFYCFTKQLQKGQHTDIIYTN